MYPANGAASPNKQVNPFDTVASVMNTGVVTLSPEDSFEKSMEIMARGGFRHLVITDDKDNVKGVLSDRDLLQSLRRISEWRVLKVHQVMTANPTCVDAETLLSNAVLTMLTKQINCLPVLNRAGKLCGLVTSRDIMKSYQNMLESMQALEESAAAERK
jgi:CBS domain-containing protein